MSHGRPIIAHVWQNILNLFGLERRRWKYAKMKRHKFYFTSRLTHVVKQGRLWTLRFEHSSWGRSRGCPTDVDNTTCTPSQLSLNVILLRPTGNTSSTPDCPTLLYIIMCLQGTICSQGSHCLIWNYYYCVLQNKKYFEMHSLITWHHWLAACISGKTVSDLYLLLLQFFKTKTILKCIH